MSEFDPNIPIYIQIVNATKQAIVSGTLKQGDRLTSVRERAETLTVNPNTVQRAYQELEREGICETRRGTGTFIVERENLIEELKNEMSRTVLRNFIDGMGALGFAPDEIKAALARELAERTGGSH
jgi:DNA-binding transcriptional regulator YhcF (GntR family)